MINLIASGLIFGTSSRFFTTGNISDLSFFAWIIYAVVGILGIWVGLAVSVKRWHDRNKSGWWVLIVLIPIIGGIWALIELGFLPGTEGPNAYGVENQPPTDPFQSSAVA